MKPAVRKNIVSAALAVVLVSAVFFFIFRGRTLGPPETKTVAGACLACKTALVEATYPVLETQPHKCPKCGKQAVYNWRICSDCRFKFVPAPYPTEDGGPPRVPPIPSCSKCGGSHTGTYEEAYEGPPAGTMPLPDWPGK